jgi:predicted O-methyltransferase YrrM
VQDLRGILTPATGEDEAAARLAALTTALRQRTDRLLIPDIGRANEQNEGSALVALDELPRVEVDWPTFVDVASIPERWGRVLFRLARHARASRAIEIGANVGVGSCWIASALAHSDAPQLFCLDGIPELLAEASANVQSVAGFEPVVVPGLFSETVVSLAERLEDESVDFVFVDAEHFLEPTLRYADLLLPKVRSGGIVVFDDIAWNGGMEDAWAQIAQRGDCALAAEPRYRGSRRLGVCVKGARAGDRVEVIEQAFGPWQFWDIAHRAATRATQRRVA